MYIKVKLSSVLLIAAALVLVFVSVNSLASAQSGTESIDVRHVQSNPDGTINYVLPGGPGFISIPGAAFTPSAEGNEWLSTGGFLINPSLSSAGYYVAPIILPHAATVTKFVAYYFDANIDKDLEVKLFRLPINDINAQSMAYVNSISADTNPTYWYDDTIAYPEVDNLSFSYYVWVMLPSYYDFTMGLISVRVDYSFPTYVPLVNK